MGTMRLQFIAVPATGNMKRKVGRPSKSFVTRVAKGTKSKAGGSIIERTMSSTEKSCVLPTRGLRTLVERTKPPDKKELTTPERSINIKMTTETRYETPVVVISKRHKAHMKRL